MRLHKHQSSRINCYLNGIQDTDLLIDLVIRLSRDLHKPSDTIVKQIQNATWPEQIYLFNQSFDEWVNLHE